MSKKNELEPLTQKEMKTAVSKQLNVLASIPEHAVDDILEKV